MAIRTELNNKLNQLGKEFDVVDYLQNTSDDYDSALRYFVRNYIQDDEMFSDVEIVENCNNSVEYHPTFKSLWEDETLHVKLTYDGEVFVVKLALPYDTDIEHFDVEDVFVKDSYRIGNMQNKLESLRRNFDELSDEEQFVALMSMGYSRNWL